MTTELDDGDFIDELASAGPKNYDYKTNQGKVCCKSDDSHSMSAHPDN